MKLSPQELATVLAALRYSQEDSDTGIGNARFRAMPQFKEGSIEPLTPEQIGELCERLNTEPEEPPFFTEHILSILKCFSPEVPLLEKLRRDLLKRPNDPQTRDDVTILLHGTPNDNLAGHRNCLSDPAIDGLWEMIHRLAPTSVNQAHWLARRQQKREG